MRPPHGREPRYEEASLIAPPPLLDVQKLSIAFGGLKAVQDFSLVLPDKALYGLIGPNGAGKTTVFNLLTGVYRADSGEITLAGNNLKGAARGDHGRRRSSGRSRTSASSANLSVLDNIRLACQVRGRTHSSGRCSARSITAPRKTASALKALDLLDLFQMGRLADQPANCRGLRPTSGGSRSCGPSRRSPRSCSWTSRRPG